MLSPRSGPDRHELYSACTMLCASNMPRSTPSGARPLADIGRQAPAALASQLQEGCLGSEPWLSACRKMRTRAARLRCSPSSSECVCHLMSIIVSSCGGARQTQESLQSGCGARRPPWSHSLHRILLIVHAAAKAICTKTASCGWQ